MALSIKNPETERLARELANVTGESLTEAVTQALRDRLVRETGRGVILRCEKTSSAFKKKLLVCRCWTIEVPMRSLGITRTDCRPEHGHRHFGADRNSVG